MLYPIYCYLSIAISKHTCHLRLLFLILLPCITYILKSINEAVIHLPSQLIIFLAAQVKGSDQEASQLSRFDTLEIQMEKNRKILHVQSPKQSDASMTRFRPTVAIKNFIIEAFIDHPASARHNSLEK